MPALTFFRRFTAGLIISSAFILLTACGSGSDEAPTHSFTAQEQIPSANVQPRVGKNDQLSFDQSGNNQLAHSSSSMSGSPTPSSDNNDSQSAVDTSLPPASSSSIASTTSSLTQAASPAGSMKFNKIGVLEWEHPTERANGEYLELDDIAGYELRYSLDNKHYESIVISGSRTNSYKIPLLHKGAQGIKVEIAVFDTDGLYSEFVDISPSIN